MFGRATTNSNEKLAATKPQSAVAVEDDGAAGSESLWEPVKAPTKKSVEQLLLERGHITEEQLDQARKVQSQGGGKTLVQVLLTMNAATEGQILAAQAET